MLIIGEIENKPQAETTLFTQFSFKHDIKSTFLCMYTHTHTNTHTYTHTYIYILEKEMRTYSSILAWEIPWTEEPGKL